MVTGWKGLGSFTWKIAWFLHRFYDKDKTSSQAERYRDSLLHSCSTQKNVVELNLIMSFSNTSCGGYTNICIMTNDNTDRESEERKRTILASSFVIPSNLHWVEFDLNVFQDYVWTRQEATTMFCEWEEGNGEIASPLLIAGYARRLLLSTPQFSHFHSVRGEFKKKRNWFIPSFHSSRFSANSTAGGSYLRLKHILIYSRSSTSVVLDDFTTGGDVICSVCHKFSISY